MYVSIIKMGINMKDKLKILSFMDEADLLMPINAIMKAIGKKEFNMDMVYFNSLTILDSKANGNMDRFTEMERCIKRTVEVKLLCKQLKNLNSKVNQQLKRYMFLVHLNHL